MLSMYIAANQDDWDIYLPYVLFAYRTTIHSSTGETPYYILFKEDPRLPEELGLRLEDEDKESLSIEDRNREIMKKFKRTKQMVNYYGDKIKQQRERLMNKDRKDHDFQVGDLVWLYCKSRKKGSQPAKFSFPWHGPFRIWSFPLPMNVILQKLDGRLFKTTIHVSRLKKYTSPRRPMIEDGHPDERLLRESILEDQNYDDQEWDVERIVDHRMAREGLRYLVKWTGYSDDENSWEPMSNLTKCKRMIDDYHTQKGLRCELCDFNAISQKGMRNHECLPLIETEST